MVVFGSSVTSACNPWSDIDIYVELDKDEVIRAPKVGVPVDVFTNFEVDTRL
ncbi:nucleotidyltransferase domain-containing protein [Acetivibrio ethanolgignens]|uniref:nucleotidyltransferase domain-containing protein n=1 Tax=Acetivibrio ethanolgignens TaxID=290052 RepID=UPI0009F88363